MPTKHSRLMVVLEPPLYRWVKKCSKKEGTSLSSKIRDLVRDAYESLEDRYWTKEGEQRLASFDRANAIPHEKFWQKLGL